MSRTTVAFFFSVGAFVLFLGVLYEFSAFHQIVWLVNLSVMTYSIEAGWRI